MELENHDSIKYLKNYNVTVKLLQSDNAPLVISFLYRTFKKHNVLTIPREDMLQKLTDYLYELKEEKAYPDSPKNYLEKWTNESYLRKYYEPNKDDPSFELTPYTEKAFEWLEDLQVKEFVGTESRLLRIYELLKTIVYNTSLNQAQRLEELKKQKAKIEHEIAQINSGIEPTFSETKIKENYYEVYDTARKLLSDFKQVEYNFRELNRSIREKQIESVDRKGKVLDDIFKIQDSILDSDQGKSFKAFRELLMSQSKQDELDYLLENTLSLDPIKEVKGRDDFLQRLKNYLIDAADKVNQTNHYLIEQLRNFIDEKSLLENKRVKEIIDEIKKLALLVKNNPPKNKDFFYLEDKPILNMILDRPLWEEPAKHELSLQYYSEGESNSIALEILYNQLYVDQEELESRIRSLLKKNSQVSLKQVIEAYPIEKGLSEIVTYLNIASKDKKSVVNEELTETIMIKNYKSNKTFEIKLPGVIFLK